MSLRFLSVLLLFSAVAGGTTTLRVCADPNNLPFSDNRHEGFENKIAQVLARDIGAQVTFEWQRVGRGFLRNVLNKGACDLLLGVPVGMRGLLVTEPYYRSTYVFVTRSAEPQINSFDDPKLKSKTIGVQMLEEDYAPPGRALARRGLSNNIRAFDMDEDPGAIVAAVAHRNVDLAVVWGPLAGYYAARYGNQLHLTSVAPEIDPPQLPFTYSIAVGVRKNAPELYQQVNAAMERDAEKIQQILHSYHVPMLPVAGHEQFHAGK